MNKEVEMIKVFWENVEFFIEKYNIPWSALLTRKDIAKAKKHELNITLKRAQRIANILQIDDYTYFFERVDDYEDD